MSLDDHFVQFFIKNSADRSTDSYNMLFLLIKGLKFCFEDVKLWFFPKD